MAWNLHLVSWKPGFQHVMIMKGRNVSGYHRNSKHIWYAFLEVLLIKRNVKAKPGGSIKGQPFWHGVLWPINLVFVIGRNSKALLLPIRSCKIYVAYLSLECNASLHLVGYFYLSPPSPPGWHMCSLLIILKNGHTILIYGYYILSKIFVLSVRR